MTLGVVTIGRRQYVSGFYWENSPSGRISQAAVEAARQPGTNADYYVTRSGNKQGRVPQFGLGATSAGIRTGMPSLAGCLANQQPGSWIGAFRLREGSALVIVRDDLIVPDGDLFFIDEVEARDRLYQEMGVGGFQRIYAPEAWGVPGADSMPITLLLNDKSDVRLHAVRLSKQAKLSVLIGGALIACVVGGGLYIQDQRDKQEALRLEQLAAEQRLREAAANLTGLGQRPEYPKPKRVWEDHPRPLALLEACQRALGGGVPGVAGWRIAGVSCDSSSLAIRWQRYGGNSDIPKGATVSPSGEQADSFIPLQLPAARGAEDLVDPDVITQRYLNQNWPATLRREPDDPPPPPPPNYKGEWNPPPAPWVKRSFTFSVPVLPWTMVSFFEDLPGIIINSVTLSGDSVQSRNSWKIEGVIYENRR